MTNVASMAITDQEFAYQSFEQLTFEALPILLVLFKHWTLNYHASTSHASVMLNEEREPMAC